jgi:hypothetical protein
VHRGLGHTVHALDARDLRPVLSALGSSDIVQGYFVLDQAVTLAEERSDGSGSGRGSGAILTADAQDGLRRALDRFMRVLDSRSLVGRAPALATATAT